MRKAGFLFVPIVMGMFFPAQASVADDKDLENIIVTAFRTPVSIQLVSNSITVITSEYIEKRQAVPVSDILRDVSGLMINRLGVAGAQTQLRVRGAEANQVLVLVNGIEVNDVAGGSEFNFSHLLTTDIERIEVLKGPQSAVWGSDALAGVINVITKKGEGPVTLSGFMEGGSFNSVQGGGALSGSHEQFSYYLNGSYFSTEGENISRQGSEKDGYENGTLSLNLEYFPTQDLIFNLTGRYTDAVNEFDSTNFITGLPADSDDETSIKTGYVHAQGRVFLFDEKWEHRVSGSLLVTSNSNFTNGLETSGTEGRKYKLDYQSNAFFSSNSFINASHTITFLFEHEIEEFIQSGVITAFGDPNQTQELSASNILGEYRIELLERLSLSSSIRHDSNSDFNNITTYRFSAVYSHASTGTQLHASYGTGSKNPTFSERFGFFSQTFFGNPDLKPEKSKGWEAGIKQSFQGGQIILALVYFNERLESEINGFVFDPSLGVFGGFTAMNTNGESKRSGFELSGKFQFTDNITLNANYTNVDATEPDLTGRQVNEIRRPSHLANANLDYTFMDKKANLNLNVNYNGKQEDDWFVTFPATRVTLNSYTLVNLTGSYQIADKFTVYGRIENSLNEDYEDVLGYQGQGLGVFFGIRFVSR